MTTPDSKKRDQTSAVSSEAVQTDHDLCFAQFQNSSVVMLVVEPETGTIMNANDTAVAYYGYARDVLIGMKIYNINVTLPPEGVLGIMDKVSSRTGGKFDFKHKLANGEIRDVKAFSSRISFKGKTVLHSIIYDVTEQVKMERALRESEERYRQLVDNALSGVAMHEIVLDENGAPIDYVFLSVNPAFEKLTGLKAEDVVGRRVTEVLPGIEESLFIDIYGRVALSGKAISFDYYGKELKRHYHIHAYRFSEKRFATVFTDTTEQQRVERKLREKETFQNILLEAIPVPVFLMNRECRFLFVNKALEKLYWKDSADLIGKKPCDINPIEMTSIVCEHNEQLFMKGGSADYYAQVQDGLGIVHDVIYHTVAVQEKDGGLVTGILGTILDVTEQTRDKKSGEVPACVREESQAAAAKRRTKTCATRKGS